MSRVSLNSRPEGVDGRGLALGPAIEIVCPVGVGPDLDLCIVLDAQHVWSGVADPLVLAELVVAVQGLMKYVDNFGCLEQIEVAEAVGHSFHDHPVQTGIPGAP